MKKAFEKLLYGLSDYTELPVSEAVLDESSYISGRNSALFFGVRRIYSIGEKYVKLGLFSYNVAVSGEKLSVDVYKMHGVEVKGQIQKIEFGVE